MLKKMLIASLLMLNLPVAQAHPHAFIDMQLRPLIAKEENHPEQLIGFAMKWTLDEASSSAVLYDMAQARGDKAALQKLIDDVIENIVREHYFSYLYDKQQHKIKYKNHAENYGVNSNGTQLQYYFDFLLAKPQALKDNQFTLMTYDSTYYVAMEYPKPFHQSVDFSGLPQHCKGSVIEPNIDEKLKSYASSLDKNQRNEDNTLGEIFAQKVQIRCQ